MAEENSYPMIKSRFESNILDLMKDLKLIEQQNDDLYKINLYLIRKYKDELVRDLDIKRPTEIPPEAKMLTAIFPATEFNEQEFLDQYVIISAINKIRDIMKEEMPEPWYCYGIGNTKLR
jgi:hypothetical protein